MQRRSGRRHVGGNGNSDGLVHIPIRGVQQELAIEVGRTGICVFPVARTETSARIDSALTLMLDELTPTSIFSNSRSGREFGLCTMCTMTKIADSLFHLERAVDRTVTKNRFSNRHMETSTNSEKRPRLTDR